MNNISKASKDKLQIFKGIVVTTSTMAESRSNQVSNMVMEMGGFYHIDFPKTTNVLVIDIAGLPNYETILKSKKYQHVLTQKLATVIIDYESLTLIHSLHKSNQLGKIHPILLGGGNGINVKSDEFLKHIMLNLLRIKYSIKPFDLLKNKTNIFFGKFNSSGDISKHVKNIKNNMSGKKATGMNINEKHYVTQISDEARDSCIFITEVNSGVRIVAAKKDRVPVVHIQWLIDVVQRNLMISYKPYMLNEISSTDNKYLNDKMMANRCWRNTDLETLNNDTALAKQVFDEFEIIDNKVFVKKNLNNKLNNTVWDKIMKAYDPPADNGDTVLRQVTFDHMMSTTELERDVTIEQFVVETNYFSNCHILAYGFSQKHNAVLNKTFEKLDCSTFKQYYSDMLLSFDDFKVMEEDYERNFGDQSKKCIIVIPHDMSVDTLPIFLKKIYLHSLKLFEENKLNWNYTNTLIVTEFHVERCLFFKKYLEPDCWSLPFYNTDLRFITYKDKFENFNWTTSGFEGVEILHINKIILLIEKDCFINKFSHSKVLNNSTDLLVVNLSKIMSVQMNKKGPLYDANNKYLNSFKPEEERLTTERQTNKNMDIDSNSYLIKKLNFIRNSKNPIPSVTPGFIFELFYKYNNYDLKDPSLLPDINFNTVKVNNTEWCITCPKLEKTEANETDDKRSDPYEFVLKYKPKEQLAEIIDDGKKSPDPLILLNNNFARPEALDISPSRKSNRNSPIKEIGSDYESSIKSIGSVSPHKLKKQKISRSPLKMMNKQNSDIPKTVNPREKLAYLFEEGTEGQSSQISYGQKKAPNSANAGLDRVGVDDKLNTSNHSLLRRSLRKRSTR